MKKYLLLFLLISISNSAQTFLLYGGAKQNEFLGCLNCNKYDTNSIWNNYGTYGSKYNSNSIWNKYGSYGGKYSTYSPFNNYTSNPPVIVDKEGNFYGYLTTNKYKDKRSTLSIAEIITQYWEIIGEDPSKAYDKIFK